MTLANVVPLAGALNGLRALNESCQRNGTCDELVWPLAIIAVALYAGLGWLFWLIFKDISRRP